MPEPECKTCVVILGAVCKELSDDFFCNLVGEYASGKINDDQFMAKVAQKYKLRDVKPVIERVKHKLVDDGVLSPEDVIFEE